jgi:hypothetical protein
VACQRRLTVGYFEDAASLGFVRLVATSETVTHIVKRGGAVYVWPKGSRCCSGRTYVLEAATAPPERVFQQIHAEHGIEVWATPGLAAPAELHLELSRRGALRAFWDGQAWIG